MNVVLVITIVNKFALIVLVVIHVVVLLDLNWTITHITALV